MVPQFPPTTALLVIDMQHRCASPAYGNLPRARARGLDAAAAYFERELEIAVPNIRRLLRAFRARRLEVIYTVIESLTADGRERSSEYKDLGIHCPPGDIEAQVIPALAPRRDEIKLSKSCASVFNGTPIDALLRHLGITHLVVTGVVLSGCVEGAVRDAADRGYEVVVAADATAAWSAVMRAAALRAIDGTYGRTLSTGDIVARLPRSGHRHAPRRGRGPLPPRATPAAPGFDPRLARRHDGRPDPPLIPAQSALLLVDFQRAFARLAIPELTNARRLLQTARDAGVEVIHTVVEALTKDARDTGALHRRRGLLLPAGSARARILPAVAPVPGEIVLRRTTDSAFGGTPLQYVLTNLGVRTLIVAGTGFSSRLESTVRDASNLGYRCVVAADACVADTAWDRAATSNVLHGIYGLLKTTHEVLGALSPDGARVAGRITSRMRNARRGGEG